MRVAFLIIVLSLFSFSQIAAQTEEKIAFGPYIQQMNMKDAVISWSTLEGEVIIADENGKKDTIRNYQQHKVHLAGLQPNTTYSYDVLNDGTDEGKGTLTTYPETSIPFNFVAIGDTRSRNNVHKKIISQVQKLNPKFIVNSGDLVANGLSIKDWETFFDINEDFMRNTPYYPVLGNHEKDSPYYYDFFDLPNNERYYYFTVGDALFVVLDSEGLRTTIPAFTTDNMKDAYWHESGIDYMNTQKQWLENVLKLNRQAGFVFIFQHLPLYSVKKSRVEESKMVREFWGDIFKRYQVQAFINGHDHHYHHALDDGIHFITSAGAGAPLYDIDAVQPETVSYKKIEHFMNIEVNEKNAVLHVIDIDGNEFDTIKIKRRKTK